MNRAGLRNFWYYDNETFEFENGKLLLRGSNGSGKSVTMQSFLPVLLDAKKTPDRLDPFGSKSRRMEDYLLGEKEVSNREERTGYLFIEYKKQQTEQYITTGIGMQAKRNRPLKSWGFVITDNRRIGHDFELFKRENQGGEQVEIPLSQTELENIIGNGGEVVKSNKEYMELVNKYIFGFETLDAYEDLIKLLIELRSPKLSRDFKPTVIYEILEAALPPLSDEDLRYLSDSIEQMDQTKQQIEQLEREVNALRKLTKAYDAYNHRILFDQISELKSANAQVSKKQNEHEQLKIELRHLDREIKQLEKEIQELDHNEKALKMTKERLQSHRIWSLEEERNKEQKKYNQYRQEQERKDDRLSVMIQKERDSIQRMNALEDEEAEKSRELNEHLRNMEYESEQSAFPLHRQNVEDFNRHRTGSFNFDVWKQDVASHTELLERAFQKIREYEQLKEKIVQKQKEIGEEEHNRDRVREDEKSWFATFSEDKQKLMNDIHQWAQGNSQYNIAEHAFQQMARTMDDLYEPHSYEEVQQYFIEYVRDYEDSLHLSKLDIQGKVNELEKDKEKKLKELEERKSQTDPEPERHEATIEAREKLKKQGEVFAAFYELVEFRPHISEDVQKKIESALIETGVLDALVTKKPSSIVHDRILQPNPNMLAHTLADYLQPDEKQTIIPAQHIEEILQSILVGNDDDSAMQIAEDGSYRIGILAGHAVPVEDVRYIGREARRRYREMLINELEREIEEIETQIQRLSREIKKISRQIETSNLAWRRFPSDEDLRTSFGEIEKARHLIRIHNERIETLSEDLRQLDVDYQMIKKDVYEETKNVPLEQTSKTYEEALKQVRHYDKKLNDFHRMHEAFIYTRESLQHEKERLDELQLDIDELKGELNILNGSLEISKKNLQQMDEELEQEGASDVRQQIQNVQRELSAIESTLKEKNQRLPASIERRKSTVKEYEQCRDYLSFWENMQNSWEKAMKEELKKAFIEVEDMETLDIAKIEASLSADETKDKSHIESRLTREFFEVQTDLMEHRMREFTEETPLEEWMTAVTNEEWLPIIELWKQKTTRRVIVFDKRGIQVTPYTLRKEVEHEQLVQENRLNEQDKELYEEILFNSVGHKLRGRIRRAEQWTAKMRKLMEGLDSSSGLKLSIRWRPKTADSEQEMDTQELVTMLKQDARLLKDEDIERISTHFRSKIQAAQLWLEEKGEGQTLLQVLKNVLDYRKWFSFVLYYERTNESRRELTNHKFFTFSGGEKAMAMYIPLFTACYSRYLEAAETAPYIISLDEAFAGVDENNINEMFELVEQLDFDYIMNSQVLWGDYETISTLSICELIRPKNADYVTVIRYKWDGQKLTQLIDEDKFNHASREETLV